MKQKLLKTLVLLCALIVGSATSWAVKITDYNNIVSGKKYYIGATTSGTDYYLSVNGSTTSSTTSVAGTAVTDKANATAFTFTGSGTSWAIQFENGNYLSLKTTKDNGKVLVVSTSVNFTASNQSSKLRLTKGSFSIQKNNSTTNFGSYGNTQTDLWLEEVVVAPAYTITAQSNNVEYGTVSLTGSVITGSPKSGYRYASPAYTVTSGEATVSQVGNEFTVTPSSECTITINFEEIPSHTLSSAVSPAAAGTVTFGSTSVKEGSTTTATAAAKAGYKFTGWSISGTGASLSSTTDNPTEVIMGTADATVTANFEVVEIHQIQWSVNGVIVKTENVEEDAAIDFSAPTSGIPNGYTFVGWVTEANKIDTPTDTDPSTTYVTSATSTADITYYAVMAIATSAGPTLTKMGSGDTFAAGDKVVIVATYSGTSYAIYQETTNSSYVNKYEFSNNAASVAADDKKWLTVSAGTTSGTWKLGDSTNGYIYNASSNDLTADTSNSSNFTLAWNSTEDKFTLVANSRRLSYRSDLANEYFRMGGSSASSPSGTAYFDIYKFNPISYAYCTSAKVSVTVSAVGFATLFTPAALDFSGVDGLTAYTAAKDGDVVRLTKVDDVPANTGVVLEGEGAAGTYSIPAIATSSTAKGELTGNATAATAWDAESGYTYYVLASTGSGVEFSPVNAGEIAAGKAFLKVAGGSPVHAFNVVFGDETGISETMRNGDDEKMSAIFDLSGRRVAKPVKGLYIVNGKKIMVK